MYSVCLWSKDLANQTAEIDIDEEDRERLINDVNFINKENFLLNELSD
jgi:hypothetical protein